MKSLDAERYRKILERRLLKLENRLDEFEATLDAPVSADDEERATEREGDEVMERLGQSGLIEIEQIMAALDRIQKGRFGVCAGCGDDITIERLDVLPTHHGAVLALNAQLSLTR